MSTTDRAWEIVKQLNSDIKALDSVAARQLLAEGLKLSSERPAKLHSALLGSATKVAEYYHDFRFMAFLSMWDLVNLRPEDHERQKSQDGKTYPSLVDRVCKAFVNDRMLRPDDQMPTDQYAIIQPLLEERRLLPIQQMVVTRIKEATNGQGRKFRFVTLVSPEGLQVECVANQLQAHPLRPMPEGKRHYVNIGQHYDVQLRNDKPFAAYLSSKNASDFFPTAVGYVEHIDTEHNHIHIYDSLSRHFVAPVQRFSRERVGDFVRFIPIIPADSKFKTAIIQAVVPLESPEVQSIFREIRITHINKEKGYAAWELVNKESPITEHLSPLQLSQGETSPNFTSGYLNLASVPDLVGEPVAELAKVVESNPSDLREGWEGMALIYLKRGKDRQKRPHVAKIIQR